MALFFSLRELVSILSHNPRSFPHSARRSVIFPGGIHISAAGCYTPLDTSPGLAITASFSVLSQRLPSIQPLAYARLSDPRLFTDLDSYTGKAIDQQNPQESPQTNNPWPHH